MSTQLITKHRVLTALMPLLIIPLFVTLAYITPFMQNNLKTTLSTEGGDAFKSKIIPNATDTRRCVLVVENGVKLSSLLVYIFILLLFQVLLFIAFLILIWVGGIIVNRKLQVTLSVLYLIPLVMMIGTWSYLYENISNKQETLTDGVNTFRCVVFPSSLTIRYHLGIIYMTWIFLVLQTLLMCMYQMSLNC